MIESIQLNSLIKVDWKYAPWWANYVAVNSNGSAYWFEVKPDRCATLFGGCWVADTGRPESADYVIDWYATLQDRIVGHTTL